MESSVLAQRLRLSPGDRADLAMALWESLPDDERRGGTGVEPWTTGWARSPVGRPREETRQRDPLVRRSPEVVGKSTANPRFRLPNCASCLVTEGSAGQVLTRSSQGRGGFFRKCNR